MKTFANLLRLIIVLPFAIIGHIAGKLKAWYYGARILLHARSCNQCRLSVEYAESLVLGCGWRP
jgi:hypothetical protein